MLFSLMTSSKKIRRGKENITLYNWSISNVSNLIVVGKRKISKKQIQLGNEYLLISASAHISSISPSSSLKSLAAQVFPGISGNLETSEKRSIFCQQGYRAHLAAQCDCFIWAIKVTEKDQVLLELAQAKQASNISYG